MNDIDKYAKNESTYTDNTFLFNNYAGPKTHIITKLRNRLKPTNYIDFLARQHDIDYINTSDQANADAKMVHALPVPLRGPFALVFLVNRFMGFGKVTQDAKQQKIAYKLLEQQEKQPVYEGLRKILTKIPDI